MTEQKKSSLFRIKLAGLVAGIVPIHDYIREYCHEYPCPTLMDRLMDTVPIYRLSCNMEPEAAKVAYEGMQG